MPAVLDRAQHRVVAVRGERGLRLVRAAVDHDREYVATARVGVTAAAGVAEAEVGGRAGEVALVPSDEDDRVRPHAVEDMISLTVSARNVSPAWISGCSLEKSHGSAEPPPPLPCMSWH